MKAFVKRRNDVLVIVIDGHLSFEQNIPFKKKLQETITDKRKRHKVVFNLQNLNFVGSSGIKDFIQILKEYNKMNPRPRFCGLKREFQWMFNAFQGKKRFFMYEDEDKALNSFEN